MVGGSSDDAERCGGAVGSTRRSLVVNIVVESEGGRLSASGGGVGGGVSGEYRCLCWSVRRGRLRAACGGG